MELSDQISEHFKISPEQRRALSKLKIETVRDLLYYFPVRYSNMSEVKLIKDVVVGETATLYGTIKKPNIKKSFRTKIPMAEAELHDLSGSIKVTWFHQPYLAKTIHDGESVKLTGKITDSKKGFYLSNPEVEKTPTLPIDSHNSLWKNSGPTQNFGYPIYRETRGLTSKWIYHAISKIFKSPLISNLPDYLPDEITKKYNLPKLSTALIWIHTPKNDDNAKAARKRFAFEEVFFIQIVRREERREYEKNKSYPVLSDKKDIESFVRRFPFTPTKSQENAIDTIIENIKESKPMARLLEGDVGSGKTAVAATASYAVIRNRPLKQTFGNLQIAYMAPTEILATQHFENFIRYFEHTGISVGLITGSGCRKFPSKVASQTGNWTDISRSQLLKWVANGEIPILIGTHALIQKSVVFKHLALVIIDEQHRFGALQRAKLTKKEGFAPHFLSMTATPIPRTLALTIYGDLDLTLLDEMPAGRKQIITEIISPDRRKDAYEKIRVGLEEGRQLYVICPRIDEPDPEKEMALIAKSAVAEAKRLKKEVFKEYEIGVLHSKMSKQKKEEVMEDFYSGKIDILCSTSVVEVGVNVPNATMIIIEGAERFGLAQLHQLRGRVLRSTHQAYCFLFPESKGETSIKRLNALKNAKNGFELSEMDLALRGAGELGGIKQWGITDLGMEAIKNIKMVEAARNEAINLVAKDPQLKKFPLLANALKSKNLENLHFE